MELGKGNGWVRTGRVGVKVQALIPEAQLRTVTLIGMDEAVSGQGVVGLWVQKVGEGGMKPWIHRRLPRMGAWRGGKRESALEHQCLEFPLGPGDWRKAGPTFQAPLDSCSV